jgi:hypothetical protein
MIMSSSDISKDCLATAQQFVSSLAILPVYRRLPMGRDQSGVDDSSIG